MSTCLGIHKNKIMSCVLEYLGVQTLLCREPMPPQLQTTLLSSRSSPNLQALLMILPDALICMEVRAEFVHFTNKFTFSLSSPKDVKTIGNRCFTTDRPRTWQQRKQNKASSEPTRSERELWRGCQCSTKHCPNNCLFALEPRSNSQRQGN